MIHNYFKIAWRNLQKNKLFAVINCFGLYAGLFFFFLIGAYIWGEYHINRELKDTDRQCFLMSEWKKKSMGLDFTTLAPLAKKLKEDYPNLVADYYRFDGVTSIISSNDFTARESIQLGDHSLLNMYGFQLLYGNSLSAFESPNSVVITQQVALKYFGKKDVVGETLVVENFSKKKQSFTITGVLKSLSKSSVTHIQYENTTDTSLVAGLFMPIEANAFFGRGTLTSWHNIYTPSFVKLQKGIKKEQLESAIAALVSQHTSKEIQENLKVSPVLLQDYYLEKEDGAAKTNIWVLMVIGGFILLMATVNFINISVSIMGGRVREIGVRKVVGGHRAQLVLQFLSESFILVLVAELLALGTFVLCRTFFSELMGVDIVGLSTISYWGVFVFLGLLISISLLSGLYPAFVLSSLSIISSLKGDKGREKSQLQKALVVSQFVIGLVIVTASLIITKQIDYFFQKDLGYNKEFVITAQVPRDWSPKGVRKMEVVRNEFKNLTTVVNASLSYEIPNGYFGYNFSFLKEDTPEDRIKIKSFTVDKHYFATYGMKVYVDDYKDFDRKNSISINESAAKYLGWKNPMEALGQKIRIQNQQQFYTIHQIVKDFHFDSMKNHIEPLVFFDVTALNHFRYLSFKVKSNQIENTLSEIEAKWQQFFPDTVFEFEFMDEVVKGLYTNEIRFKNAVYYAAVISFLIVLLGVVGLVLINIQKREKELAVRKVLGASLLNNVLLFTKEMSALILIAFVIATPLVYYSMSSWLSGYAYSIKITTTPFVVSIISLWAICSMLIIGLTFKVAKSTPLKTLKTE
ncbi:ABC transporter permease [Wenyingzhuangia sp. IMCC45574]